VCCAMRVYKTSEIRNVAVVGHGASGKTSLVDALAFVAGTSKRHGSVKDGTALTDYTPDEIERKYSINLALAVAEWMDAKLNLIDTPGYLDFTGEALAAVYAADGAVVVVSATGGVEVGMLKGELFPLFCGAAELTYGTRALLSKLVELIPAPHERPPVEAQRWGSAERVTLKPEDEGRFVAQVFKTISEPHVGDVTFFRGYSGRVKNGQDVYNAPREAVEKLNHLCVTVGKDRIEIPELHAGDIGVVAKLRDTHTNDTLSTKDHAIVLPKIPFPEPVITEAIEVKQRGEEEKLS